MLTFFHYAEDTEAAMNGYEGGGWA
jgi:hypothetical protein